MQFCLFVCSALVYYCPECGSPVGLLRSPTEGAIRLDFGSARPFPSFSSFAYLQLYLGLDESLAATLVATTTHTHAHKSFLRFVPTIRCGAVPVGAAADSSHRIATAVMSNACRVVRQNNGQMKCHGFANAYGALHNFIDGPLIDCR